MGVRRPRLVPVLGLVTAALVANASQAQDSKADILPITTARIDQLVKGLEAEYVIWKPAFDRDQKRMQASAATANAASNPGAGPRDLYRRCEQSIVRADTAAMRMGQLMHQKFMAMAPAAQQQTGMRMSSLQDRVEQLEKEGPSTELEAARDTLRRAMFEISGVPVAEQARVENRLRAQVEAKCGREPRPGEDVAMATSEPEQLETDTLTTDAGLRASGLRARQYAILRERVAAYVLSKTEDRELGDYVFTAAEKAALEQRLPALRKYADLLATSGHWQFD